MKAKVTYDKITMIEPEVNKEKCKQTRSYVTSTREIPRDATTTCEDNTNSDACAISVSRENLISLPT
jgi:hypothetical protein